MTAPETTPKQPDSLARQVDDLSALVNRLAHALKKAQPDSNLPTLAEDYLKRQGMQGFPLRDAEAPSEVRKETWQSRLQRNYAADMEDTLWQVAAAVGLDPSKPDADRLITAVKALAQRSESDRVMELEREVGKWKQVADAQNAKLMAMTDEPGGMDLLRKVLAEAKTTNATEHSAKAAEQINRLLELANNYAEEAEKLGRERESCRHVPGACIDCSDVDAARTLFETELERVLGSASGTSAQSNITKAP